MIDLLPASSRAESAHGISQGPPASTVPSDGAGAAPVRSPGAQASVPLVRQGGTRQRPGPPHAVPTQAGVDAHDGANGRPSPAASLRVPARASPPRDAARPEAERPSPSARPRRPFWGKAARPRGRCSRLRRWAASGGLRGANSAAARAAKRPMTVQVRPNLGRGSAGNGQGPGEVAGARNSPAASRQQRTPISATCAAPRPPRCRGLRPRSCWLRPRALFARRHTC